jgi:hypothetical protein
MDPTEFLSVLEQIGQLDKSDQNNLEMFKDLDRWKILFGKFVNVYLRLDLNLQPIESNIFIENELNSAYYLKRIEQSFSMNFDLNGVGKEKAENHFYENLGINIIFGKKVDENGVKLFLPNQFMESLRVTKYNGKLISEEPKTILKASTEEKGKSLWNNFYTFCLALFLIFISRKVWIYLSFFIMLGFLGLFLSTIGLYSLHEEVTYNYNILLFNPLLLILIIFYWQKNYIWVKRMALICLFCLVIMLIVLLNKPNLLMFLPMITCSGVLLYYFIRRSNQELLTTIE